MSQGRERAVLQGTIHCDSPGGLPPLLQGWRGNLPESPIGLSVALSRIMVSVALLIGFRYGLCGGIGSGTLWDAGRRSGCAGARVGGYA